MSLSEAILINELDASLEQFRFWDRDCGNEEDSALILDLDCESIESEDAEKNGLAVLACLLV